MPIATACKKIGVAALGMLLGACGGGGGGGGPAPAPAPAPAPQAFGLLKPVQSERELADALREGLIGSPQVSGGAIPLALEDALGGAPDSDGNLDFSSTTLQEQGVDEADIVKYDGEVLYVLNREPNYVLEQELTEELALTVPTTSSAQIHLIATDPAAATAEELAVIDLKDSEFNVDGLYLHDTQQGRQLVGVGQSNGYLPWEVFSYDYYWSEGETSVVGWDVSNPGSPSLAWSITLEGGLLASRRIDNRLYLVTRFTPSIPGVVPFPVDDEQIANNQELLGAADVDVLLPTYHTGNGNTQSLVAASDCLVPNDQYGGDLSATPGGSLITVTVLDLQSPETLHSLCLNSTSSGFYVSPNSLYITETIYDKATLIHKVALGEDGPNYRGSGQVPGYIGSSNPAFLMSENDRDLRVVSSLWDRDNQTPAANTDADFGDHRLTILRESDDGTQLSAIAQLPNSDRPQAIGKPGEDVYAARFLGNRAYVVTFEIIDPLYVIDLSDPEQPQLAGELEIPGFSTLLQPLGDALLLGIGNDVPVTAGGFAQGVKVALFDVANPNTPIELGSEVIGKRGSFSPALYNHHALTIQNVDGRYRATLPVMRHEEITAPLPDEPDPSYWYNWTDSGLYLFDIEPASGSLALRDTLLIEQRSSEVEWPVISLDSARAVIHGDALYLLLGDRVLTREW